MSIKKPIVAEVLLSELYILGVEFVFLVPGAQIIPLVFQLYEEGKKIPKPIIANHELAAGFMALGYARASGKMGVAFSIGGPGAAFMVGAGVTAKTDDVPVLFVSGNIPPESFGVGEFQDASPQGTNDCAIFRETVGTSMTCNKPEDLPNILAEIRKCDAELRSLHVQIPISIQKANCSFEIEKKYNNIKKPEIPLFRIDQKIKTVLLIGQKAMAFINQEKLSKVVSDNCIALVTDMKTRGIISETEREAMGYIGFNSDIRALEIFNSDSPLSADQIITVGIKEDLVNQYLNIDSVERIKIDPAHINYLLDSFSCDTALINEREKWLYKLNKFTPPQPGSLNFTDKVSYSEVISTLKKEMPNDTVYCLDSGQIRRAGSIFLNCHFPRTLIQSETLSPMGLGICSSIGAQLANPEKKVVCLFGDGSMKMNGIELSTAVRYKLPIIFVLCDNEAYASIKAPDIVKKLPKTDWEKYGNSIGISTFFADNQVDFSRNLTEVLSSKEPALLWTKVPGLLNDELKKTETLEYQNWLSTI